MRSTLCLVLFAVLALGAVDAAISPSDLAKKIHSNMAARAKKFEAQNFAPSSSSPNIEGLELIEAIEDLISAAIGKPCLPGICSHTFHLDPNGKDSNPCTEALPCLNASPIFAKYQHLGTESNQFVISPTCGNYTEQIDNWPPYFWRRSKCSSRGNINSFGNVQVNKTAYCHRAGPSGQGSMIGFQDGFANQSLITIDCSQGTVSNLAFFNSMILQNINVFSSPHASQTTFLLNAPIHGSNVLFEGGTLNAFGSATQFFASPTVRANGPTKLNFMSVTMQPVPGLALILECDQSGSNLTLLASGMHWNGAGLTATGKCGALKMDRAPLEANQNLNGNVITNLEDGTSQGYSPSALQGFSGVVRNEKNAWDQMVKVYSPIPVAPAVSNYASISRGFISVFYSNYRQTGVNIEPQGSASIQVPASNCAAMISILLPVPFGTIVRPSTNGQPLIGSTANILLTNAPAIVGQAVRVNATCFGIQFFLHALQSIPAASTITWSGGIYSIA